MLNNNEVLSTNNDTNLTDLAQELLKNPTLSGIASAKLTQAIINQNLNTFANNNNNNSSSEKIMIAAPWDDVGLVPFIQNTNNEGGSTGMDEGKVKYNMGTGEYTVDSNNNGVFGDEGDYISGGNGSEGNSSISDDNNNYYSDDRGNSVNYGLKY